MAQSTHNFKTADPRRKGFTLLEVVIGTSLIAVSLFSLMSVATIAFAITEETTKNIQASFLIEEGIEALKILRDSGWGENIDSLSETSVYYYEFSSGNWRATSTNIYIDGLFERSFILEDVYRDPNDDIVESGGVLDPDTKKITVTVSWHARKGTTTENISTYITNVFNN